MSSRIDAPDGAPERECRLFSRHLIGAEPSREIVDRYGRACARLLGDDSRQGPTSALDFARAHPWSIGLLDAGCGLIDKDNLLRRRLLILTAILEATPDHVEAFLAPPRPVPMVAARLALTGIRAALRAMVGVPLLLMVGRR